METIGSKPALGAIALAILALPAPAAAESVVPPENSAANQYTEAIPTGGGNKDAGKTGNHGKRTPSSVLGPKKAEKLESKGPQGREAAEVAAATAPAPVAPQPQPQPSPEPTPQASTMPKGGSDAKPDGKAKAEPHPTAKPPPAAEAPPQGPQLDIPSGSSGLGEVLAQATGSSSSGQLGALLPLLIVATIVWSLAFFWRQRQRPAK